MYMGPEEGHGRTKGRLERSLCYWTEIEGSQCVLKALIQLRQRNRETDTESMGRVVHTPPSFLALSTETAGNNRYTWAQILVSKCDSPRTLILKKVTGSRAGAEKYRMSLVVQKVRK